MSFVVEYFVSGVGLCGRVVGFRFFRFEKFLGEFEMFRAVECFRLGV